MHVGIEAVGTKHSGGAVVLRDIVEALLQRDDVSKVTVFGSPKRLRTVPLPQSSKLNDLEVPSAEQWIGRWWWLHYGLQRRVASLNLDVLLLANGVGSGPKGLSSVAFVQQALPFSPEGLAVSNWVTRVRMFFVRRAMERSCHQAPVIIVQTPTMRESVSALFGIAPDRVEVFTPSPSVHAAEREARIPEMEAVSADRRLLYVGSDSPHKNLPCVVSAMASLRARVPGATLFLSLPPGHPYCREAGVVGLGYLGEDRLATAYRLARIVVMPSWIETCGLPMVEALACGTPVLAADRPYARDMCRDAAVFFDPSDSGDFVAKAVPLLQSEDQRHALLQTAETLLAERTAKQPYAQMAACVCRVRGTRQEDSVGWHSAIAKQFDQRYVDSRNFRERYSLWTQAIEQYSDPHARVLDAGCGTGVFAMFAAKHNRWVLGVDGSREMLALCREKLDETSLTNVEFRQADLTKPAAILQEPVDLIICSSVLEYLDDVDGALQWFVSALNPKGRLLISMPNRQSVYRRLEQMLFWLTGRPRYYRHVKHVTTQEHLASKLSRLGVTVVRSQSYGRVPGVSAILGVLGLRRYSDTLFLIVGQKR